MDSATPARSRRWALLAAALLAAAGAGVAVWYLVPGGLPKPGTPRYERYVEAFEIGTAALDTMNLNAEAEKHLGEAIKIIPGEPAAWLNRALVYLRTNRLKEAAADLTRAERLAPGHPSVEEFHALLEERRGRIDPAIDRVRKALQKTPDDFRRLALLSYLLEVRNAPDADEERFRLNEQMLARRPAGLPLLAARLELAARLKDKAVVDDTVARLKRLSPGWTAREARNNPATYFPVVEKAVAQSEPWSELVRKIISLNNLLRGQREFTRLGPVLRPQPGDMGASLQNFVRLAPLRSTPDEPDEGVTFAAAAAEVPAGQWAWAGPVWLTRDADPAVAVADAKTVRVGTAALAFPSGGGQTPPSADGVLSLDLNNDLLNDFLLVGAGGLRFSRQRRDGAFEDVTAATKLPKEILEGDHYGAWAADADADGDLDVVLAPRVGAVKLLRNNGDGTFTALDIFPGVAGARAFVWADLDNDGAADASLLDAEGRLHFFFNERSGLFRRSEMPEAQARYASLAAADVNDDGTLDLVALRDDGAVVALTDADKGDTFRLDVLAKGDEPRVAVGAVRLYAADADGNGAIDLLTRGERGGAVRLLADGKGGFTSTTISLPPGLSPPFADGKGGLAVVALDEGRVGVRAAKGTKGYTSRELRFRHDPDGKNTEHQLINSFTLGGEAEVRCGSLIVKRPIDAPAVHVGLGRRSRYQAVRIVWPNGAAQYEIDRPADEAVTVNQRLTGSCPFLFTWDGDKMVFVTDFCWSTPLGLYINAQKGLAFEQTTEWLKVRDDQLRPRDGKYDVRVNANLWETHYLDLLSLMVVDHPPATELHLDERFFLTPTPPRLYLTTASRPVAKAVDQDGKDVTDVVKENDARYLDGFGLGRYQGVTRDHWVTVDVGDVPGDGPVYLLAHGWLQPTDSSINFALEQSSHAPPRPLALEVDEGGGWKQVGPPLGFPAGKNKTMVIRLPDGVRQARLRTNLEIYWDSLRVARGLDEKRCVVKSLSPTTADLQYRGVVRMSRADRSSPELPHYDDVVGTGQPWRDLIGFHTRFGDVRELIHQVDDRYVLMNAGDELRMTFDVPEAGREGWRRDFVWVSDGWTKDGNLNTRHGKTVLPLPWHGMKAYDAPPGRLEDDPVYRRHRTDWDTYHTRYVTPALFARGLRGR